MRNSCRLISTEQVSVGLLQHIFIDATIVLTATSRLLQNILEESVRQDDLSHLLSQRNLTVPALCSRASHLRLSRRSSYRAASCVMSGISERRSATIIDADMAPKSDQRYLLANAAIWMLAVSRPTGNFIIRLLTEVSSRHQRHVRRKE